MIMERIVASEDIRQLSAAQSKILAAEIRDFLVQHVSETGGHLAANLGVVELTIALHQVFDVVYDRIIWDVGHQSYVHKILTGRWKQFSTLRQMNGLSGFPKTEECQADAFNTGHSSTSISAAAGFAAAARLRGEERAAVAVIGDGSLTGGMAFEAMNHIGAMKTPMIVVLNDNGMSISKNVGGLARRLKRLRHTRRYFELKTNVKGTLEKVPVFGKPTQRILRQGKKMLKRLLVQNGLFEDLGFYYLGPVDGHNIEDLKEALYHAKALEIPVLVHVRTKKGKGYLPAERNPELFHGISRFDLQTGRPLKVTENPDWSSLMGETLIRLAEKNPKILAITAAMPMGTGLKAFQEKFPQRFFNVGIAEQHAVTFAGGLAKAGMIPCFAVYSTFLQRGYDQLLHDVSLQKLHTIFCIDRCGPVGADGETHQGVFDLSYLLHMPGFTVLSPSNDQDFVAMLSYATEEGDGPIAIRYPRGEIKRSVWKESAPQAISKSLLRREGSDVLIAAVGTTVYDALAAAEILAEQEISVAVLDVRSVKPLDEETLFKHSEGKRLVVSLEDNVITGGFGQQLLALLQRKVTMLAYPDVPIVQGSLAELKDKYGLSAEKIAARIFQEMEHSQNEK